MKGLDLKKFKKVSEDEHKAVLRHDAGHEIHIAKHALSKANQNELSKLEVHPDFSGANVNQKLHPAHMADGGQVDSQKPNLKESFKDRYSKPKVEQDSVKTQSAQDSLRKAFHFYEGGQAPKSETNLAMPESEEPSQEEINASMPAGTDNNSLPISMIQPAGTVPGMPAAPEETPVSGAVAGPAAPQPANPLAGYGPGASQLYQGMAGQQAAESEFGKNAANIAQQEEAQQTKLLNSYQKKSEEINNEYNSFLSDYQNQHINPNHYMESMDTGQKISTAIGLIAAGLTGGGEHAVKFLNDQIDRDIKSQMAELGKKHTLLSANIQHMGNMQSGIAMTKLMMNGITISRLQKAEAQVMDPMAKARLQQNIGNYMNQNQSLAQGMALDHAMKESAATGQLLNIDPATLVKNIPKEHQAKAYFEVGQAQNAVAVEKEVMDQLRLAAKENTILKTGAGLARTPASILRIRALMLPLIHDQEGRVNEFEQKTTSDLEPKPGDSDAKVASKIQGMQAFIEGKKASPTLAGNGIDLKRFISTARPPRDLQPRNK